MSQLCIAPCPNFNVQVKSSPICNWISQLEAISITSHTHQARTVHQSSGRYHVGVCRVGGIVVPLDGQPAGGRGRGCPHTCAYSCLRAGKFRWHNASAILVKNCMFLLPVICTRQLPADYTWLYPTDISRNNDVVIASKTSHFEVITSK